MEQGKDTEMMKTSVARAAKGGQARAAAMTPEQRSESARKAVQARWLKERKTPSVSISSASADLHDREIIDVALTRVYHAPEPHIKSQESSSWSANSPFFAIMPNETGSSTQ